MSALVVTGSGTEIGKTFVACALIRALRAQGRAADALKPVVTGFDDRAPEGSDPALLLDALGEAVTAETLARVSPWRFAAPLAANLAAEAEGRTLAFQDIADLCRARIAQTSGLLVIEGAGGVMAPTDAAATFLDLIAALAAPALLVTGSYLGSISHTLTALATLEGASAVAGVVVNESTDSSVDFEATVKTLAGLRPDVAFIPVRRGDDPGARLAALV